MPRRRKLVNDTWWAEVETVNHYALFMGYLSMAVNGMGFLVLTWTTVVLLGGFVSDLHNKDFWCLTFITLVQTAGIFDVFLTEKLNYIGYSFLGFASVGYSAQRDKNKCLGALSMLHVVLLGILLCPLVVVYNCGLFISAGISVWRLIQHDYHADGVRNLKQALDVLYYLALLQSTIFCYKCINGFAKGFIVNSVAQSGNFDEQSRAGISEYLLEMMAGCQKDRMYTRGRNLITYAVDLMGSKSPDDYMSGLRILDTCAVQMGSSHESGKGYLQWNTLKKHLIMSVSSPNILPKLLQTLGRISIYDRETRGHAARVVASIAHDIHLEEFPGGIRYISSLIDTFEKYHVLQPYEANWLYEKYCESYEEEREQIFREERHGKKLKVHAAQEDSDADLLKDYADLVAVGFLILQKLATNHDNCKVMLGTPCLLPKIMAPVTADLLHPLRGDKNVHINHDAWYRILEGSLRVIVQLTAATGETGSTLRRKISSRKDAIITLDRILECGQCNENLKKKAIWILTHLHEDASWTPEPKSREKLIKNLVEIMAGGDKHEDATRVIAANALLDLSSRTKADATFIMKANDNVVDSLKTMLLEKRKYQSITAEILEYICIHYTNDDEILKKLKEAMADAVPKLFEEILCWATRKTHTRVQVGQLLPAETHRGIQVGQVSSLEEIHRGAEAKQASLTIPENDIENQPGYSQGNGQSINSSSSQDKMNKHAVVRMLSLCVTVCDTFFDACQFDAITKGDGSFSFPMKLKLIVKKCAHPRPDCLRILKPTCKMIIWMMKHRNYGDQELKTLKDALCSASEVMFLLDSSMVFDIRNDYATTTKPFRSLDSLLNEAHVLIMNRLLSLDSAPDRV